MENLLQRNITQAAKRKTMQKERSYCYILEAGEGETHKKTPSTSTKDQKTQLLLCEYILSMICSVHCILHIAHSPCVCVCCTQCRIFFDCLLFECLSVCPFVHIFAFGKRRFLCYVYTQFCLANISRNDKMEKHSISDNV